jgi:hypothetical protein
MFELSADKAAAEIKRAQIPAAALSNYQATKL